MLVKYLFSWKGFGELVETGRVRRGVVCRRLPGISLGVMEVRVGSRARTVFEDAGALVEQRGVELKPFKSWIENRNYFGVQRSRSEFLVGRSRSDVSALIE